MDDLEPLVLRDHRGRREIQVSLDLLGLQEMMVNMEPEDLLDLRVRRASLGFKEDQDPGDHQELRGRKVTQELLDSLATPENKDLVVSRESLETLVIMEEKETEESKVTPGPQANQGFKDLLASLECRVHLGNKATLDLLESRETLDLSDLQDYRVHLVTKDLQDLRDLPD